MTTRAKNWILRPYLDSAHWIEEESTILVPDTFCVLTSVMGGIKFGWLAVWVLSLDWLCHKLEYASFFQALESCSKWVAVYLYPQIIEHGLSGIFLTFSGPLLTHSIEQSPSWEANRFSASQEIPRISWKPKVHNRIQKSLPPVRIFSQFDPVHTLKSHFLKIIAAPRRPILLPQYVLLRIFNFALRLQRANKLNDTLLVKPML
jgi:hypothetical protein